jgi:hypothetical protein
VRESSVTNPENWSDEGYDDINMLCAMKVGSFFITASPVMVSNEIPLRGLKIVGVRKLSWISKMK